MSETDTSTQADRSLATRIVPEAIRKKYSRKIGATFFGIIVLLALIGVAGFAIANTSAQEEAGQQFEGAAASHADSIDEWVGLMESHTVTTSSELGGVTDENLGGATAQRYAALPADIRSVHIISPSDGTIVTSTDPRIDDGSALDDVSAPWATISEDEVVFEGDVWVSDTAYQSEALDDQVMAFASPVENRPERLLVTEGTIQFRINNLQQFHDDQQTTIMSADGETIFETEESDITVTEETVERLGAQYEGSAFESSDEVVMGYAATRNNDWVAVTVAPEDQVFAVRDIAGFAILGIIGAGVVLLAVSGVAISRQTAGPLETLSERAENLSSGNYDVDLSSSRSDEIGKLYQSFGEMRDSLVDTIREAESERKRVQQLNDDLERSAEEYSAAMAKAADGDFTVRTEVDVEEGPMAKISKDFNEMMEDIESTIDSVAIFSREVATESEEVTASVEEVQSASENISNSVQQITNGADQQRESFESIQQQLETFSTSTEQIATSSNQVADLAEESQQTTQAGEQAAEKAIKKTRSAQQEANKTKAEIDALEEEVREIDELIETVQEIAKETNMLALNANIEASRSSSSDGGEGFSVVANEVKELSEKAKEAAEEAEERLSGVQEQTVESVDEVDATVEKLNDAVDEVHTVVGELQTISDYVVRTNDGVQQISAATEQQAATTEEILSGVEQAAVIAQQTSTEASTVASATEEQTAATSEVAQSASRLAQQSNQLASALDQFDTAPDETEPFVEGTDVVEDSFTDSESAFTNETRD